MNTTKFQRISSIPTPFAVLTVLTMVGPFALPALGCSDDSSTPIPGDAGADGDATRDGAADSVEAALTALGVDVGQTPRRGGDGEALPDDYSPLGSRPFGFKLDELLFAGIGLEGHSSSVNLFDGVPETRSADGTLAEPFRFDRVVLAESTWDSMGNPRILARSAVAADVDGDGRDELVVVLQRMSDSRVYAVVQDDQVGDFATTEPVLLADEALPALIQVELAAGDVDADGVFEVTAALVDADGVTLWMIDAGADHGLTLLDEWTQRIDVTEPGAAVSVGIATGNLDDDNQEEVALVVNELFGGGREGTASLLVFDSGRGAPARLEIGAMDVSVSTDIHRIRLGDCAIGDVDGDGRPELVVGGLVSLNPNCDSSQDIVVGAFHQGAAGLVSALPTGAYSVASLGACESTGNAEVQAVFVETLDADGDGDMEVTANQAVLDFDAEARTWGELGRLSNRFFLPGEGGAYTLDRANTEVAIGDVTGDGRDDVTYVTANAVAVAVWGASTDPAGIVTFGDVASFPVDSRGVDHPLIVPVNVDSDTYSLSYSPADYQLIFTEPVIVAALAAAPCYAAGQNSDACATSFGRAESTGTEQEYSFTVTASLIVGLNSGVDVPFVNVEAETEHTFSAALGYTRSHAYNVEKSVVYTTGSLEDSVIFTSVPYDQYTYVVLDHPDATQVGNRIAYFVPRDPVTLQVERGFYEEHVVDGGPSVGSLVFAHTPGDPRSYPSTSDRDDVLRRLGGLATDAQAVGQGGGSVEVGLDVSEEWGNAGSLTLGYEFAVKATAATFIAGYSVGVEAGVSLGWTSGVSSSYHGTVGNLSAETFADNQYSFGLFTYTMQDPSGREYQVLNYWVE